MPSWNDWTIWEKYMENDLEKSFDRLWYVPGRKNNLIRVNVLQRLGRNVVSTATVR